jgi:hypothetical protein
MQVLRENSEEQFRNSLNATGARLESGSKTTAAGYGAVSKLTGAFRILLSPFSGLILTTSGSGCPKLAAMAERSAWHRSGTVVLFNPAALGSLTVRSPIEQATSLRTVFLAQDETCLLFYEADSANAATEAARRAGLTCERISPVIDVRDETNA